MLADRPVSDAIKRIDAGDSVGTQLSGIGRRRKRACARVEEAGTLRETKEALRRRVKATGSERRD